MGIELIFFPATLAEKIVVHLSQQQYFKKRKIYNKKTTKFAQSILVLTDNFSDKLATLD
jgi:hypothetical protein